MMMLAKAVYDNDAETSDELTFRQGDVLNVLQRDFNGLEGWWLCSLRGKTGIAPGNRLKQIKDVFEVDVNKANSKNSQTLEKVITPKKVGGVFLYDSPVLSNYNAKEISSDYDQPRPGAHPAFKMEIKEQQLIENMQDKLRLEHIQAIESLYDSPGARQVQMLSANFPGSNRSSSISMSSVLSSISGTGTGSTGSAPPSERSSCDVTHDVYDIPASSKSTQNYKVQKSKSSDMLDTIETYDFPPKNLKTGVAQFTHTEPLYHTPGPAKPVCTEEAGDYCEIHDDGTPTPTQKLPPKFNQFKQGKLIEQFQAYDSPRSLPVLSGGDYDVPPQVSRDSSQVLTQNLKNSVEISGNLTQQDIPDLTHRELRLEVGSAVTLLNKQQQDLHKSIERLLAFVGSGWRKKDNLEPKLFDVKISCIAVKTALEEFVDFGNGAVANSASTGDKNIYFACKKYFEPVSAKLSVIQTCMKALDDIKWDIAKLSMETLESCALDDDLNKIITSCRDLPVLARQLAAFIQSRAAILFRNYQLTSASVASQSPPRDESKSELSGSTVKQKPKPPVLKPKPKLESLSSRDDSVPSPATKSPPIQPKPEGLKNLPVTKIKTKLGDEQNYDSPKSVSGQEDYDVPKTKTEQPGPNFAIQRLKATKVTPTKLTSFDDGNKDYDNAETRYRLSQLQGYNDEEQIDYDYAVLTPDMHKTSLQYKYEQEAVAQVKQAGLHQSAAKNSQEGDSGLHLDSANKGPVNLYDTPSKGPLNQSLNSSCETYDTPPTKENSECYDTPPNKTRPNQVQPSQEMYDSPVNKRVELYDSPSSSMSNQYVSPGGEKAGVDHRLSSELDMSGQVDKMQVPSIRTSGLSPKFKEKLEKLRTDSEISVIKHRDSQTSVTSDISTRPPSDATSIASTTVSVISDSDKQVLAFYANQLEGHVTVLNDAMEALFQAVDYNQPPKVFIADSKFVILAAHKLVYIGDTISRNVSSDRVRSEITAWSNQLCDSLKATVTSTKQAALQYPNTQAMQEMVNKATHVSQVTNNLKNAILRYV